MQEKTKPQPHSNDLVTFGMLQASNQEILLAIQGFADNVEQRFTGIDQHLDSMDSRFDSIDNLLDSMDGRVTHVESQMVTKDYLDEKLFDLKGDMIQLLRKEDKKVVALVRELADTNVISKRAAKEILELEPFAK